MMGLPTVVVLLTAIYLIFWEMKSSLKVLLQCKKNYINFPFDCNGISVVYLLTCSVCQNQYIGYTLTKFRLRFSQYKSNIKLYLVLSKNGTRNHNGTYKNIKFQIEGHCDPNHQKTRVDVWIQHLDILYSKDLNHKAPMKY